MEELVTIIILYNTITSQSRAERKKTRPYIAVRDPIIVSVKMAKMNLLVLNHLLKLRACK